VDVERREDEPPQQQLRKDLYYAEQRARGHSYRQALRALSAKWLKIIFVM
jgi:hypothetical protein